MAYASKEIENFIENFPDEKMNSWYDHTQYNCEIADFIRGVNQLDFELCLSFYARQEHSQYFEIAHPVHNHIKTRAVYSVNYDAWFNIVFFVDEKNEHPWVFLDSIELTTMILPQKIFNFGDLNGTISLHTIQSFLKGKERELRFRNISWGFNLHRRWPMHYFWETLSMFLALNTNKNILDAPSYFIPKKYWDKKTTNEVYFTFNGIPVWNYVHFADYGAKYTRNCAIQVYEEAIQDFNKIVKKEDKDYDLVIWLSLTSSYWGRKWLEQIEGYLNIIKEFAKSFKSIKIYYDGFTSYEPQNEIDRHSIAAEVEAEFMDKFTRLNLNNTTMISLNGLTFREKICYCSTVDIAFCELGTASVIPESFCQKPCVFVAFSRLWYFEIALPIKLSKTVSREHIQPDEHLAEYIIGHANPEHSYHIPWQHIYNLAAEILEELFKSRGQSLYLYRLQVPSVRLVAKEYELLQKQKELGLKPSECLSSNDNQKTNIYFIDFVANEWVKKEDYIRDLEDKNANLNTQMNDLQNEIANLHGKINSVAEQSAAEELKIKKLQVKELEKKLGLKLSKLEPRVVLNLNESLKTSAVARVRNHLAYRLGAAIIVCSKSLFGLCSLPFVLSFIKAQYKKEQAAYKALITQRPQLKLSELENYVDFKAALNEKECFTYKLGLAFIKACKTWYKGGFVKFYFEAKRLYKEFKKQQKE